MLKEFFGFSGFAREAEGFLSWQHLAFASFLMAAMFLAAFFLGRRDKGRSAKDKNRALALSAILMDGLELTKILLMCTLGGDPGAWLRELPLYMCSIQLITLPLAAFARGRIKEAALDFVAMFGLLGAVLGTYGAGNNYACYPVISFHNVFSGLTHALAGFAALYILMTGMATMKKTNMGAAVGIILAFGLTAYAVNHLLGTNYMFLMRGDGTPYEILYSLAKDSPLWYPLGVMGLFLLYIALFYRVFQSLRKPG